MLGVRRGRRVLLRQRGGLRTRLGAGVELKMVDGDVGDVGEAGDARREGRGALAAARVRGAGAILAVVAVRRHAAFWFYLSRHGATGRVRKRGLLGWSSFNNSSGKRLEGRRRWDRQGSFRMVEGSRSTLEAAARCESTDEGDAVHRRVIEAIGDGDGGQRRN